jgi:hypothetical protein
MEFQHMKAVTNAIGRVPAEVNLEPLLDEREVEKITKRSLGSIRRDRLMLKGVPFLRIGNSVRYAPAALRAYLKSCEVSK